ncbi:MAG: hypothetical protein IH602_08220 [Bryobacteraceae bacterium]|nr:hypothetical protein [Bryobacteraceae bacterium]
MALMALAIHTAPLLSAQESKLPPEVRSALDQAATLKVELAADLLFGLIDSGKVPRDTSLEYLERLYYRASEAQRSFPMIPVPRSSADTKNSDFPLFLSQLSVTSHDIRLRAVLRMGVMDKNRSRQLLAGLHNEVPSTEANCEQIAIPVCSHNFYSRLLPAFPEDFGDIVQHVSTPQQSALLIGSVLSLKNLADPDMTSVTASIAGVLETAVVSDRTFSSTELKLGLGALLEKLVASGSVPPGAEARLVKAYVNYAARHLGRERCADAPRRENEDAVIKATVSLANRFAEKYQFPRVDTSRIEMRYSTLRPEIPEESGPVREAPTLIALARKLLEGGSPDVAARFATELQEYASKGLRPGASAFDIAGRAGMLMALVTMFDDEYVTELAVKELFRVLEHPRLIELDATAWMVVARTVFNLLKHPRVSLAQIVSNRIAASTDTTLISYYTVVRFIGMPQDYIKEAFSSPGTLMTKY